MGPRLENGARYTPSDRQGWPAGADHSATAPTVITPVADAGLATEPGRSPVLPAAATTTTPSATAAFAAWLTASRPSDPSSEVTLTLITSTLDLAAHHSMPSTTSESCPIPLAFSTFTADSDAAGATPLKSDAI